MTAGCSQPGGGGAVWRLLPPGQPAQLRAVQRAGKGRDEGGGGLPGAQGGRGAGGAVQPGEC